MKFTRRQALLASAAPLIAGCSAPRSRPGEVSAPGNESEAADDETESDDGIEDSEEEREQESDDGDDESRGTVVIVYDDGPMQDYTQAFPVQEEFDYPASVGVVSSWIGRTDYMGEDWMDSHHLDELAAAGWEIQSHTKSHAALGSFALTEDCERDDDRVYVEHYRLGHHQSLPVTVQDESRSVTGDVVGFGASETGRYIEFAEPISKSFEAGTAYARYSEDVLETQLHESNATLTELGYDISTLLAPYDWVNDLGLEIARTSYDGVVNVEPGSPINEKPFDPFATNRDYVIEFTTPERTAAHLDTIAETDALGVFGAHTSQEEVTPDRIREFLSQIEERDLEVLTFAEAIDRYGE